MKKELTNLLNQIDKYDVAYYNLNQPLISDQEYDGKKDHLKLIISSFKPTTKSEKSLLQRAKNTLERVGAPISDDAWGKYTHEVPMGSLNKVNLPEEFKEWTIKCDSSQKMFLVTEKLDGISISLKYENGILITGATRGDGNIGEDITRNVKKMRGVPNTLNNKFTGHIRGEIVLRHSDLEKYFPNLKSARNGAGGIAKRLDGDGVEYLTVISYNIEGIDFINEHDSFVYINNLGFIVPNYILVNQVSDVIKTWNEYMDHSRDQLDYDIDGLVVHINDRAHRFALGEENNRPKGSVAFKFEPPEAKSIINNIICQVGDTGIITPVVEFDPVNLLGASIKRASVHNFQIIKTLGINIGSEVIVIRANDVIPQIKNAISHTNKAFEPPNTCPACGSKTVFDGAYLVCTNNRSCPPQVQGRINKWIKENGILEWGDSIIAKIIESGVTDVDGLYKLSVKDLQDLDRMGEKSANNLINELNKYRSIPLENFLGGLCIKGVATSIAKSVVDAGYDTLDKILNISVNELERISGFGQERARAFHEGLLSNADRIEAILNAGVTIREKTKGKLSGNTFCFTGSMSSPRALLQKMVEENGGEIKKSVAKGLSYLVIDDPDSSSSKAQAAKKLEIVLLSEEKFLDMIKKN